MLKNYIVSALRNSLKNGVYSLLNILGLTIGTASCMLILQYVVFERSYNDFHENGDNIYRISYLKEKSGIESFHSVLTYSGVGPLMVKEFPEVVNFTRLRPASVITSKALIQYEDRFFEENDVYYADTSFFEIFSFKLLDGDPNAVLKDPFTAVVSQSFAQKYFGNEDAIGKTIRKGRSENLLITGIMADAPANSHVNINVLISHSTLSTTMDETWTPNDLMRFHGHLYIETRPGTNPSYLEEKFPQFVMDYVGGRQLAEQDVVLKFWMLPLKDIHLKSHIEHEAEPNGDYRIVDAMLIVAGLILFIALVNYVNMSTARAMERSKEIGIRKVIGASKSGLMGQYMVEAFINFLAILFSLLLILLAQPFLSQIAGAKFDQVNVFGEMWFWKFEIILWVISSILSGIYPAMVLSSYNPVIVLKGKLTTNRKGIFLRKGLVLFQFVSSVSLIIGTLVIFSQINFMRDRNLGMTIDDKLVVRGPMVVDSTYNSSFVSFKNSLLQIPAIENVTASQSIPGKEYNSATWFTRVDKPEVDPKFCYINTVDLEFAAAFELTFVAGSNFSTTDEISVLMNETAARQFEFDNFSEAIGKSIAMGDPRNEQSRKWRIKGIIKDFNQQSLKEEVSPVILFKGDNATNFYSLKLHANVGGITELNNLIDQVRVNWFSSFSGNPFDYYFLREGFDEQYKSEIAFGRLLSIFSGLTIFISILGLIGLSSYSIQQRTKEIGIRKVLGSSISNVGLLLSKDVFTPILFANAIAWPICWYLFSKWLDEFAYRMTLSLWPFIIASISILCISALAVVYQLTKTLRANPVNELKYE